MKKSLRYFEKYEVSAGPPLHISTTSVVVSGNYRKPKFQIHPGISIFNNITTAFHMKDDNPPEQPCIVQNVVMKFMKSRTAFLREIETRKAYSISSSHVFEVIDFFDSEDSEDIKKEFSNRGFPNYPYCIVLPRGGKSLRTIIYSENIAGVQWSTIRNMAQQIMDSIAHLHDKGIIHCHLTPLKLLRIGHQFKVIDLDSSQAIGTKYKNNNLSCGYLPTEMIYYDEDSDSYCVKEFDNDKSLPYEPIICESVFDSWSTGAILYILFTGRTLFHTDNNNNIGQSDLKKLFEFSDEFKNDALQSITNDQARNLVSLLLMKEPRKRITLKRALHHPFITKKTVARLPGEAPEFDVFLSYRVSSDFATAQNLYNKLTDAGIKVWWDNKCLRDGEDWENGFCEGLVKSAIFVPLLSRRAINDGSNERANFTKLTAASPCDNVLLEYLLALNLKEMGYITHIFPIMIGDLAEDEKKYTNYFQSGCHPNLEAVMNTVVKSVQTKLCTHLDKQGLGTPLLPNLTVKNIVDEILKSQGHFIQGMEDDAFDAIGPKVARMKTSIKNHISRD